MWQTYTPDGSVLVLRLEDGIWVATCLGARAEAGSAEDAIREVLRVEKPSGDEALERWIADHVAELDGEAQPS